MNKVILTGLIPLLTIACVRSCHPRPSTYLLVPGTAGPFRIVTIARSPDDMHEFILKNSNGFFEHWPGCVYCDYNYSDEQSIFLPQYVDTKKTLKNTKHFMLEQEHYEQIY